MGMSMSVSILPRVTIRPSADTVWHSHSRSHNSSSSSSAISSRFDIDFQLPREWGRSSYPLLSLSLPSFPTLNEIDTSKSKQQMWCHSLAIHRSCSHVGVWAAFTAGITANVVPLDEEYFDEDERDAMGIPRSSCECVKEGAGCAVCGNPLGTIYKPYTTSPFTLPSFTSNPLLGPEGSAYYSFLPPTLPPYIPGSNLDSTNEKERVQYSYTFLPSHVSSQPGYVFPERHSRDSNEDNDGEAKWMFVSPPTPSITTNTATTYTRCDSATNASGYGEGVLNWARTGCRRVDLRCHI